MDNNEGSDSTSPIARIKRRTKSKHHPDSSRNYDPDLNDDNNNNKENFDQLNRQNTPNANEGIGGRDVIYSKDDNMVGILSTSISKTDRDRDRDRERSLIFQQNLLDNQPFEDQIKFESELAKMNMEKAKYYINEERRRRGDPSNSNDNDNDNDSTVGTQTNLTREQMIQAAEESAFSAKLRGNQPSLSPTTASSYNNSNYNRGNNNSNNYLNYNKHETNDNLGTGHLMKQVNSNINFTLEKFNKNSSEFIQETYQEPSLRPGNVQLGLPRVYIPEKYADFLLNDENSGNGGKVKKEKKLPLYMKVMAEAERQAQIEERNRNEMISKVKREKQKLGKIDIKTHMVNHDKLTKEKYGDRKQLSDVSAGRSDNNLKKMDRLDSLPPIKNQNEREIDRESSFAVKKSSKMNKLQRGIDDDELANMSNIGNNRNSNNIDQYNTNNVRLPSIIFDEGGPTKGVKKSSAYLRIQRENKNKKDKKELEEEERREKLRRMREFGKNLRVLASQKEAELLHARKQLDDPYESPKKGTQMVSPRIKNVSELTNRINSFNNYSNTTKSKMSSSRSSGNGNISQEDTVNIQRIDSKSGKIRTKYDYMDESHEASDGEMHGFSLLSSDRTPFKSPKKVRFDNVDEDLDGFSQVFKISDQMKSPMKGEIEGSSNFLYSPSLKSNGNKKFNNSNDSSNSNSNDDDPVVMLSKVAGGPMSYHPDWVNQLLTEDPDEEKYTEIYEQGYSIMMLEYGIISEL